ncbi:uncharacterized protein LOC109854619 [Pseudomyrmex gracilis]|uniref:uncharacterized protein LOC109854619 n=1 Tax=Pseudomyrmex gracilis TaxID=219809 RepID=UPI0009950E0E|nr:uncharacterized protein LOC109854619 [Pseudomyrmex gracilis]
MQLAREYTELIERDSEEISFLWKGLQMLCYFASAVSGYSCAMLFYILWNGLFGGHCPLWAKLDYLSESIRVEDEHLHDYVAVVRLNATDWKRYVIVSYDYEGHCEFYHAVCFISCIFGIVWLTMFLMCGKGGYDSRSQESIIST